MQEFDLKILEADSTFFEGKCVSLIVPTTEGFYGIQAHHENFIASLVIGEIKYTLPNGTEHYASTSDGLVKVEANEVLVLVETAEDTDMIDADRALAEERESLAEMREKKSAEEYRIAQARMARAINRIKVKMKYGTR